MKAGIELPECENWTAYMLSFFSSISLSNNITTAWPAQALLQSLLALLVPGGSSIPLFPLMLQWYTRLKGTYSYANYTSLLPKISSISWAAFYLLFHYTNAKVVNTATNGVSSRTSNSVSLRLRKRWISVCYDGTTLNMHMPIQVSNYNCWMQYVSECHVYW